MRAIQKSKQVEHRHYLKMRDEFLEAHPLCQAKVSGACQYYASDVHHTAGRTGKLLLDQNYWMAICRLCHDFIHNHVAIARQKGWLVYLYGQEKV